jgi:uncharacterized protein (TIGR00299 family) protein
MPGARFAIIDPSAGVSGDMLLGALVASGAPTEWLTGLPARLGIPEVTVDVEPVDRCGVRATKVHVRMPGGAVEEPADVEHHGHAADHAHHHAHDHGHDHAHAHAPAHGHHHHGPHRHVGELIAMIERAPLSDWVRERAVRAFRLVGEAEGRVHGMPADRVALHEVGALDALVDVVGVIEGFERLGVTRIHALPVAVGAGWVRAAHGVMAVPTPATAILLEGLEVGPNGPVVGEAVTPTGAALLRVLADGPPPSRWRPVSGGGFGAGTRNPGGYPNVLRLILGEAAAEAARAVVVATDLDDLSPEYLEPLREELFEAGAVDVQLWSTYAKKGRIGCRVEAVCPPEAAEQVTEAFFRHSTTAGVRRWTTERTTLARREVTVPTDEGKSVRVKVLEGPDGPRAKPEYDDVTALARMRGQPAHEVARDLQRAALRLVRDEAARGSPPPRTRDPRSEE